MNLMFNGARAFNQQLVNWDTSNCTTMSSMFASTNVFNNGGGTRPLIFDTSKCTSFASMFLSAPVFNQQLISQVNNYWNTSSCLTMQSMFSGASVFNNGGGLNPLTFNTINCTSFASMFSGASNFNQQLLDPLLTSWNTSNCTTMSSMFFNALKFNNGQFVMVPGTVTGSNPLTFNMTNCSSFASMFLNAQAFNQTINFTNTNSVTTMQNMFSGATAFNNGAMVNVGSALILSGSGCSSFAGMFQNAQAFNQNVNNLLGSGTGANCSLQSMFSSAGKFNNGEPSGTAPLTWITGSVTTMAFMFQNATLFNQNIGNWNTTSVTNMASIFQNAQAFNNGGQPFNWTASPNCTSFASMFQSARVFNQSLPNLVDTSGLSGIAPNGVCSLSNMFNGAAAFNNGGPSGTAPLSWNTSKVTNMSSMFLGALAFNQNLSGWNTGLVTDMSSMFSGSSASIANATIFNNGQTSSGAGAHPLTWNTSNVLTMANMFRYCIPFNQNITKSGSNWNTNLVTTVASQFQGVNNTSVGKCLFNNGQLFGEITAPMGWTFNNILTLNQTNFSQNSNLTQPNKPAGIKQ
jgi:surface protein